MNFLQRWIGAQFLLRDVRKTISAIEGIAPAQRAGIAQKLAQELETSAGLLRTAGLQGPDAKRICWQELLLDATAARQVSLALGAQSRSNPQWAKAALFESWLLAASGQFVTWGNAVRKQIDDFVREHAKQD